MPIKLNSDAGGSVTLDTVSTASTYNITIPASNGTFAIVQNDGVVNFGVSEITFSNSVTIANNFTVANNISVTGTIAMGSSFKRNRLINGDMKIWQRGTSFTVAATGSPTYTADRWGVSPTGASVGVTLGGGPAGFSQTSLVVYGNSGLTSVQICQRIEAVNCVDLSGKYVTVSGYIWQSTGSPLSGVTVRIARANAGDNYTSVTQMGSTYTIPTFPSSQWTRFTCTFTTDAYALNGVVLLIDTNTGYSNSAVVALNGMQLEVGTVATPYEFQMFSEQLAQCQRYYEKSYELNTAPGSQTTYGAIRQRAPTVDFWYYVQYKVAKRASPSSAVVYSNRIANAPGYLYQVDGTGYPADRAVTTSSKSETGFQLYCSTVGASGALVEFQWAVDAEL